MSRNFMAIGECLIEIAPNEDGSFRKGFAGDTFNSAWYAKRLLGDAATVSYMTAVGSDEASRQMLQFMRDSGVVPVVQTRTDRTVGLYMISLKDGERSFSYWRDTAAARTLGDDLDLIPGVSAGDIVLFSGITLAVLPEAGRMRLLNSLAKARAAGAVVAFDPNLRPRLWTDDRTMCEWVMKGASEADIALPSFEDEADFFGDADTVATAQRYLDAGAQTIVVKDGPNPVLVWAGAEEQMVPVEPATEIVDTTAAGDSFNARFIAGLINNETPAAAAAAASLLSKRVIAARGALVAEATD